MAYATVQDMRDEGVTDPPYSDQLVQKRIDLASTLFEDLTGKFFERRDDYTLRLDGQGQSVLLLPVPPINATAVSSVTVNGEELDSDAYSVWQPYGDAGKLYPRLIKTYGTWRKGTGNIVIVGSFGYVDDTEEPPALVKDAVLRMATELLPQIGDTSARRAGLVKRERNRDYEYELSEKLLQMRSGRFDDPMIPSAIARFKGVRMAAV